jgi:hypothetical protein
MKFDNLLFEGSEHALRRYVVGPTPEDAASEAARRAEAMAKIVRYVLDRAAAECLAQAAEEENPVAQMACQECAHRLRGLQ